MTVRDMTAADAADIHTLETLCFSDPWSVRDIESTVAAHYTQCLTLTEGDLTVGYVLTSMLPPEGEILRIAVHPAHRGRHLGHALMHAVTERARALGVQTVFLEVRSAGIAARALYRAHGFTETGVRRAYYRDPTDDAVLMRLDVTDECR